MSAPRRVVASWTHPEVRVERELVGTAYRVYLVRNGGPEREGEREFTDPIEAQHYWLAMQQRLLEQLLAQIPPPPPPHVADTLDFTDVDDLPDYVGEYPPMGRLGE